MAWTKKGSGERNIENFDNCIVDFCMLDFDFERKVVAPSRAYGHGGS